MLKKLDALLKNKSLDEARQLLPDIQRHGSRTEYLLAQAAVDFAAQDHAGAESRLLLAMDLPDKDWRVPLALCRHYVHAGNQERARRYAQLAYECKPEEPEVLLAYMHTLLDVSDYRKVLSLFKAHRNAIKLNRSFLLVAISALRAAGRLEQALNVVATFLKRHIDDKVGLRLLADIHADKNSTLGLEKYKKVIARQVEKYGKKDIATCWNAALHFLRHREFQEGWSYWEMGFGREVGTMARRLPEQLNKVRRIGASDMIDPERWLYLMPEQGIGDQILFLSALDGLLHETQRVILVADPRLAPLLKRSFPTLAQVSPGIIDGLDSTEGLPSQGFMPYGSLPAKYRLTVESFRDNRRSFLKFDDLRVNKVYERFRRRAAGRPIIGLSWKGGFWESQKKNKGLDLTIWVRALKSVDAQFICLQYGDVSEAKSLFEAHQVKCTFVEKADFTKDIEAWIQCIQACDGIFSVSTALVHFSAALGVPTKIIMPKPFGPWILGTQDEEHMAYANCTIARMQDADQPESFLTEELGRFYAQIR